MLAQGREGSPERMRWGTLTQQDRDLDDAIAAALHSTNTDPDKLAEDHGGWPS